VQAPFAPSGTPEHVAPPLHDWHGPLHVSTQQMPSPEQKPLAQSPPLPPASQSCPLAASHVCAAEQTWLVGHRPGAPTGTGEHVAPPLQDWHGPLHASAQQTPSLEQKPLSHSWPCAQPTPFSEVKSKPPGSKALHAANRKQTTSTAASRAAPVLCRDRRIKNAPSEAVGSRRAP
jgi:hypothetical protein